MVMFHKLKYGCRNLIARLQNFEGNPRKFALGIAIGVFVGVTPLFPFHTAIALFLAMLLNGSRIAAAAGVWVSNPVTMPLFYIISYKTGMFFLGKTSPVDIPQQSFSQLVGTGLDITQAMITGSILVGFILSVAAYVASLHLIAVFRNRRVADG
jgi:uncharacterized protein (DUF2062 family)